MTSIRVEPSRVIGGRLVGRAELVDDDGTVLDSALYDMESGRRCDDHGNVIVGEHDARLLPPPTGDRVMFPPPGCTGRVMDGCIDTHGNPIIVHEGGTPGRRVCPAHANENRARTCTCRQMWLYGGAPHASSCPLSGPDDPRTVKWGR